MAGILVPQSLQVNATQPSM